MSMAPRLRTAVAAAIVFTLLAGTAEAATGGVAAPDTAPPPQPGEEGAPARNPAPSRSSGSLRSSVEATPARSVGGPVTIRYRVDGRAGLAEVRLYIKRVRYPRQRRVIVLGRRATGRVHEYIWRNERRPLAGRLAVSVWARDRSGNLIARSSQARGTAEFRYLTHVFPIAGQHSWPSSGGGFGADRGERAHQGQDLTAAEGTPLVAVANGTVAWRRYQEGGAGQYVVLRSPTADFVYMHMRAGSVIVAEGQRLTAGQQIGEVGSTGRSSGPHLHFEIWAGRWYEGGKAVDPAPRLRRWARQGSE